MSKWFDDPVSRTAISWSVFILIFVIVLRVGAVLHYAWFHRLQLRGPWVALGLGGYARRWLENPRDFWAVHSTYYDCSDEQGTTGGDEPQGKAADVSAIVWAPLFSRCVVSVRRADLCRRMLSSSTADISRRSPLHPSVEILLGNCHLPYLTGPTHVKIRSSLRSIFSTAALARYLPFQEDCIRDHLIAWSVRARTSSADPTTAVEERQPPQQEEGPGEELIYDLVADAMLELLVGRYCGRDDYAELKSLFRKVSTAVRHPPRPFYFFGTGLFTAVEAKKTLLARLEGILQKAFSLMFLIDEDTGIVIGRQVEFKGFGEPMCVADVWLPSLIEAELVTSGSRTFRPKVAAETLFSIWMGGHEGLCPTVFSLIHTMRQHPDIITAVAEEQVRVRGEDFTSPLSHAVLRKLDFTHRCVLEELRLHPSVVAAPQWLEKDLTLAQHCPILRKGCVVIPDLAACCRHGYETECQLTGATSPAARGLTSRGVSESPDPEWFMGSTDNLAGEVVDEEGEGCRPSSTFETIATPEPTRIRRRIPSPPAAAGGGSPRGTTQSTSSAMPNEVGMGFTDPLSFDPDRMSRYRQEHLSCAEEFLPFGSGMHMCLGQRCAEQFLTAFLSLSVGSHDDALKQYIWGTAVSTASSNQ